MAVVKFNSMLGLAAMLVCLLIGTVACLNDYFTPEERKAIPALFEEELEPDEAFRRLESIKDKYEYFEFGLYSVHRLLAFKDYTKEYCTPEIVHRMSWAAEYFSVKHKGLYKYVKESYDRMSKLCADNYEEIVRMQLDESQPELLKELTEKMSKKKLHSRDYRADRESACLQLIKAMFLGVGLEGLGYHLNIDDHWQESLKACRQYLKDFPKKKRAGYFPSFSSSSSSRSSSSSSSSSSSGLGFGSTSDMGTILPFST